MACAVSPHSEGRIFFTKYVPDRVFFTLFNYLKALIYLEKSVTIKLFINAIDFSSLRDSSAFFTNLFYTFHLAIADLASAA